MANDEAAKPAQGSDTSAAEGGEPDQQATLLRVRVLEGGRPTVNIKVPIGVAKWGMKMAQAFSPQMKDADLDWEAITAIIQEGQQGKIVEVETRSTTRPLRSGWNDRHGQRLVVRSLNAVGEDASSVA